MGDQGPRRGQESYSRGHRVHSGQSGSHRALGVSRFPVWGHREEPGTRNAGVLPYHSRAAGRIRDVSLGPVRPPYSLRLFWRADSIPRRRPQYDALRDLAPGRFRHALNRGVGQPWPVAASHLLGRGLLVAGQADQLGSTWEFGKLIANTDMHDGNASLIFSPTKPVRLAPIYDMLPMAYRPDGYGRIPGLSADQLAICSRTPHGRERDMARAYWTRVAESPLVSAGFRAIAHEHSKALSS